jgi:simple sugar transport system permease protein
MEEIIISTLQRTLVAGTPLLLATTGEIICERSGILNLGVEGL